MLILTRRPNETVEIGDNISLTVLEVRGNQVRIGINAPKHIPVHRSEIADRIRAEKQAEKMGLMPLIRRSTWKPPG